MPLNRPHIDQEDRDAIEDRGLVDDDRTEDLNRVCTLCGGTGWRPGRMAVIPCNHRGTVARLPDARTTLATSDVGASGEGRSGTRPQVKAGP
jgi:hypothetical protein